MWIDREEMIKKIMNLAFFNIRKSKNVQVFNGEQAEQCEGFHMIPLYSKKEMRSASETNDENVIRNYLYRQALNGYVGIYKNKWLIGKGVDGQLVKIDLDLFSSEINDLSNKVLRTQSKAKYGYELKDHIYCKLSYDLKDQNLFATHVKLENEYTEGRIYNDSGIYGGLHFSDLENFEECLQYKSTFYGNKIVILEPLAEFVYYQYMGNVYIGEKIMVLKVSYMDDVDTWKQFSSLYGSIIKNKRECILEYLENLKKKDKDRDYKNAMTYIASSF